MSFEYMPSVNYELNALLSEVDCMLSFVEAEQWLRLIEVQQLLRNS